MPNKFNDIMLIICFLTALIIIINLCATIIAPPTFSAITTQHVATHRADVSSAL